MEMVNESEQEKNRIYKSQFQWGKTLKLKAPHRQPIKIASLAMHKQLPSELQQLA